MNLTTKQVAAKLGLQPHQVLHLVDTGKLTPLNRVEGKRTYHEFDSAAINEFKKTYVPRISQRNGRATAPVASTGVIPVFGEMLACMQRIEAKTDALLKAWGIEL